MGRYVERDYRSAIPQLRASARDPDRGEAARFFLGICLLLTGQPDEGVRILNAVGDHPRAALAEEARFFSARGQLLRGNAVAALAAPDRTIDLHGDREGEARALRAAITNAQSSPK